MGDISEDVILAQQQQSTEDKTELCVGAQPASNDKMRSSKQELVATAHKMTQIEEMSEYCIGKMVQDDEETRPEMINDPQQQDQITRQNSAL